MTVTVPATVIAANTRDFQRPTCFSVFVRLSPIPEHARLSCGDMIPGPMKRSVTDIRRSASAGLRIISGGQTGVDRAALDAAVTAGLPTGGWCPRGRRSEDGLIPPEYPLRETSSRSYAQRTEWNVRDSDGTLILVRHDISSGTRLTIAAARSLRKPLHIVCLDADPDPGLLEAENSWEEQLTAVVAWLQHHKIHLLNVAGPRGSSSPQIYGLSRTFLDTLFSRLGTEHNPRRGLHRPPPQENR